MTEQMLTRAVRDPIMLFFGLPMLTFRLRGAELRFWDFSEYEGLKSEKPVFSHLLFLSFLILCNRDDWSAYYGCRGGWKPHHNTPPPKGF